MLRKLLLTIIGLGMSLSSSAVLACGDYCGLYSTGGYNLLDVSISVYSGLDYAYTSSSSGYSGGCGSFLYSCNSAYDSVGLYGNSWSSTYTPDVTISINLDLSPLTSLYSSLYSGLGSGLGMFGGGMDPACAIGYCSPSTNPFAFPGLSTIDPSIFAGSMFPYWPTMFPYPSIPAVYPMPFPTPTFPPFYMNSPTTVPNLFTNTVPNTIPVSSSGIFTTPTSTNPFLNPSTVPLSVPPTQTMPPYGACDNVLIPCPMSPINPTTAPIAGTPTFNPVPTIPTLPNNPVNPLQPSSHIDPINPNRGQIPRQIR